MSGHVRRVLIAGAEDFQLTVLQRQPCPAAAEARCRRFAELLFERGKVAERRIDGLADVAAGIAARVRAHDLPEEIMVRVTAAVIDDGLTNAVRQFAGVS